MRIFAVFVMALAVALFSGHPDAFAKKGKGGGGGGNGGGGNGGGNPTQPVPDPTPAPNPGLPPVSRVITLDAPRLIANNLQLTISNFPSTNALTADMNGDGLLDIISRSNRNIVVLGSDGTGGYSVLQQFLPDEPGVIGATRMQDRPGQIAVGDLNGDGAPDIVAMVRFEDTIHPTLNPFGVKVWINLGGGQLAMAQELRIFPPHPVNGKNMLGDVLTLVDIDDDGDLDIAASVHLHRATGFPGFYAVALNDTIVGTNNAMFADADYRRSQTGQAATLISADADMDGLPDLAILDWAPGGSPNAKVSVLLNRGKGIQGKIRTFSVSNPVGGQSNDILRNSLAFGDMDYDGMPDLIAQTHNHYQIFLNGDGNHNVRKAGRFKAGQLSMQANTHRSYLFDFTIVDLNNDGAVDMLSSMRAAAVYPPVQPPFEGIQINTGIGRAAFFGGHLFAPVLLPGDQLITTGDFDNDGDEDLVVQKTAAGGGKSIHLLDNLLQ